MIVHDEKIVIFRLFMQYLGTNEAMPAKIGSYKCCIKGEENNE